MVVLRVDDGAWTLNTGSSPLVDAHWLVNCLGMQQCSIIIYVSTKTRYSLLAQITKPVYLLCYYAVKAE